MPPVALMPSSMAFLTTFSPAAFSSARSCTLPQPCAGRSARRPVPEHNSPSSITTCPSQCGGGNPPHWSDGGVPAPAALGKYRGNSAAKTWGISRYIRQHRPGAPLAFAVADKGSQALLAARLPDKPHPALAGPAVSVRSPNGFSAVQNTFCSNTVQARPASSSHPSAA